ncbi:MAG: LysM peptidoglycan-binding domain-containing protein [Candidatus Promineifilaceae bacterium]
MKEESQSPSSQEDTPRQTRCPTCDSVVPEGASRCLMCGKILAAPPSGEELASEERPAEESGEVEATAQQPTAEQAKTTWPASQGRPTQTIAAKQPTSARARPSAGSIKGKRAIIGILIGLTACFTALFSLFMLRGQDSQLLLALQPTFTPLPPPPSLTPTWTPEATETPPATETPIPSRTPVPTDTPRPPRFHPVASGETIFGLSLFYRISAASIAEANNVPLDTPIQVGQELNIPWPTATPPLESMVLQVGEETFVADVTDCSIITIEEGDSIYGLSSRYNVPAEAIVAVNRLTEEAIQLLHPGDALCIPRTTPGDTLPATPGPQPTVTRTAFPAGTTLLYPVNRAEIDPADGLLRLQWVSVKDLADEELYMVEMTDLNEADALPYRAFTRDSSLEVPSAWRPDVPETHDFRWRVSIVREIGQRPDGEIMYEYGGQSSEDSYFSWLGALPTATPTMTPSPTPELAP